MLHDGKSQAGFDALLLPADVFQIVLAFLHVSPVSAFVARHAEVFAPEIRHQGRHTVDGALQLVDTRQVELRDRAVLVGEYLMRVAVWF